MLPYFFLAVLSPLIHCSPLLPFSSGSALCSVAWDPAPLSFFITSGASPSCSSCLCSPNYSSLTWLYKAEFPQTGKPLYPSHLISSPCDPLTAMQQRKNTRGWCGWTRLRNIGNGSDGKESACTAGDPSSIPGSGRSPGGGNGNSLQYSCLGNPVDRKDWQATIHGVTKSQTRLSA